MDANGLQDTQNVRVALKKELQWYRNLLCTHGTYFCSIVVVHEATFYLRLVCRAAAGKYLPRPVQLERFVRPAEVRPSNLITLGGTTWTEYTTSIIIAGMLRPDNS